MKIIIIKSCSECPYMEYNMKSTIIPNTYEFEYFCSKERNCETELILNPKLIPPCCPLEDKKG